MPHASLLIVRGGRKRKKQLAQDDGGGARPCAAPSRVRGWRRAGAAVRRT